MRFRPSPLVTGLVFACVALQLRLAGWQYGRHLDQAERQAAVALRLTQRPTTTLAGAVPWSKTLLTGRFRGDHQYLTGRFEFGRPGLDILDVFETSDGQSVLVNRGWIPLDAWEQAATLAPAGPAEVEGLLMPADRSMMPAGVLGGCTGARARDTPLPADDELPERWAGPNWPAIQQAAGTTVSGVLYLGPELVRHADKPHELPATGYVVRPKTIGHLSYAGQWFLIALVFLGGWAISGVRRARTLG